MVYILKNNKKLKLKNKVGGKLKRSFVCLRRNNLKLNRNFGNVSKVIQNYSRSQKKRVKVISTKFSQINIRSINPRWLLLYSIFIYTFIEDIKDEFLWDVSMCVIGRKG